MNSIIRPNMNWIRRILLCCYRSHTLTDYEIFQLMPVDEAGWQFVQTPFWLANLGTRIRIREKRRIGQLRFPIIPTRQQLYRDDEWPSQTIQDTETAHWQLIYEKKNINWKNEPSRKLQRHEALRKPGTDTWVCQPLSSTTEFSSTIQQQILFPWKRLHWLYW